MSIWGDDVGMADYSALRPASGAWQDVGGARQRTEALYESMRDPDQKTGLAGIGQVLEELNTTLNPEEEEDTQEQDVDALLEVLAASGATQEPDVSGGASQIESSASDRQPGFEEYSPGILKSILNEYTPKDEESIAGGGPEYTDASVTDSAVYGGALAGQLAQPISRKIYKGMTGATTTDLLKGLDPKSTRKGFLPKGLLKELTKKGGKKAALRLGLMGLGPVGAAINLALLAGELGYAGAKHFAPEATEDFQETVGGGLRDAWDWIKGDGEVGRNTKADGGRIHLNTGGVLP